MSDESRIPHQENQQVSRWTRRRRKLARMEGYAQQPSSDESEERDLSSDESDSEAGRRTRSRDSSSDGSETVPLVVQQDDNSSPGTGREGGSAGNTSDSASTGGMHQGLQLHHISGEEAGDIDSDEVGINSPVASSQSSSYSPVASSDSDSYYEDSGSEIEDHEHRQEDRELLYPGAPITVQESLTTVLTLAMKHHLTGVCVADILKLINVHCPANNQCVNTLYKFKKYFSMIGQSALNFHYYCGTCEYPVESKDSICKTCQESNVNFFIEVPLKKQLQTMLMRPGFYDDLQFRFNRRKRNVNHIEEIYDSCMYEDQFANNGFLSHKNNISFTWYTDGVSVYKSSKFSIWPLFFVINELCYSKRTLRENVILAGLWFGSKKPNPNVFLQPFYESLSEFRNEGYVLNVPNQPAILMKGMLLCGVADLPAKSLFLRFKQYNGSFGCANCTAEGMRYNLGNASVQVYPYTRDITLRNNEDIGRLANEAVQLRQVNPDASVLGVKGPSLLYKMVPNMVRGTCVDKMHGVDYGVFKLVVSLMFDTSYANEPFSVSAMVGIVDDRLSNIKPPSFIERVPRSIKSHLALWKSAEYKVFLMILSIPVLLGIVDDNYLEHHCLLVSAIYLLSQTSISHEQIHAASELLHMYVSQFEQLYGVRYLSMNVHQLLHLPQTVKDNGPLWVYACYFYEGLNGELIHLIHGTRHAGMQVCSAASAYLNLPSMINSLPAQNPARVFCESMNSHVKCVKIASEISPGVYAVGTFSQDPNNQQVLTDLALQNAGIQGGRLKYFHRLRKKGIMYYSSLYKRSMKKESSYVQVVLDDVPKLGRIVHFVKWSSCIPHCPADCVECPTLYFVIVKLYEREAWFIHNIANIRLPHLNKVHPTENVIACTISDLQYVCYHITVDEHEYLVTPVNELEYD